MKQNKNIKQISATVLTVLFALFFSTLMVQNVRGQGFRWSAITCDDFQDKDGKRDSGDIRFFVGKGNSPVHIIDNEAVRIEYETGNLGIATTEPTRKLDVNGAIRVRTGGINGDPLIDLNPDGGGVRWSRINSKGNLAIAAGDQLSGSTSNPHLFINTEGNLGIGIIDPTQKLDVNGSLRIRTGGNNGDPLIDLDPIGDGGKWGRINSEGNLAIAAGDQLSGSTSNPHLFLDSDGNVYIPGGGVGIPSVSGSNKTKYNFFVTKGMLSEDYGIGPKSSWADDVFEQSYELKSLTEVEQYITVNKHLPGMLTQKEVSAEGYSLHDMNVKLLKKVEELTLYAIDQEKKISALADQLDQMEALRQKVFLDVTDD